MRMRMLLNLAAIVCCCWLGSAVSAATLTATIIETDTSDYAPGDSVIITGTGYWPNEQISVEITNILNPGVADSDGPWYVWADGSGNFETYWIVPNEAVDQSFLVTAIGMSSGIVSTATFTDANSKIEMSVSANDTLCAGNTVDLCAFLTQSCPGGLDIPLPNRMIYFFFNPGNCSNDGVANDSALTDANGIACATLQIPVTPGNYALKVRYNGESATVAPDPPNSVCDTTDRVNISNSVDCQGVVVANTSGFAPSVTLPADTTIFLCGPDTVCLPVTITDPNCDIDSVTSNIGQYGGNRSNFDQVSRIRQLVGTVTQVGGGSPGLALYDGNDFVPPVSATSGVSVTLTHFNFLTTVSSFGTFSSSTSNVQYGGQIRFAPTDMTYTLVGAGGPDGGNGDGSLEFTAGSNITGQFASLLTSCDGQSVDLVIFTDASAGGVGEVILKRNGISVYAVNLTFPAAASGSGMGGITVDLPDHVVFNQVYIEGISGTFRVDAVGGRFSPSPTSEDICFAADTAGVYTVIVSASDNCAHSDADTMLVTVTMNQPPVANAGADSTVGQCVASQICKTVSFSDPNNNIQTTQLLVGPGTLTGNQICFTPSTQGTIMFVVAVTDSCGLTDQDTVNITVTINSAPVATNPPAQSKFLCSLTQQCYTFSATDPDGGTLTWALLSGPGSITTGGLYCFTPASAGVYNATVTVTDNCGLKDTTSIQFTIAVNGAPVAVNPMTPAYVFQCTPAQICYLFTASDPNGNPLTWTKLSGAGTVTSGGDWCFTPASNGAYSVTVQVADSCGAADTTTLTYNVVLNGAPTIAFGNDTTLSLCTPQQICLSYSVSDPQIPAKLTETMISGYGTLDTLNNRVCFTPVTGGTYQFIIAATDSCGASDVDTINANVSFGVFAQITCLPSAINVTGCAGGQVCQAIAISPLDAIVTTSYGTYSSGNLCFQADTSGQYTIRIIASAPCGADTCDVTFNVTIDPDPDLVCPGTQTKYICAPGQICIPVGGAMSATWQVTPIGTYSSGNVCFNADTSGVYILKVKATTPCGVDSCNLQVNVTINSAPVATNPPANVDTFLCASSNICRQFSATDINGGTLTWTRLSGAGTVSSSGLWCFTASATGSYSVVASVTDSCGAADTISMTYTVTMNSAPTIALGNDTTIFLCSPGSVCLSFATSDPNNNVQSVSLLSGSGTIALNPNQLCFTAGVAGMMTFVAQVSDSCGATDVDTINVTIQLNHAPVVNAGPDQTIFQCAPAQICWPAGATDPDNNLSSVVMITGPGTFNGSQICFTPSGTLNYEFVLKATDACGVIRYDTVVIYYTLNSAPIANAGADQTVFQCAPTQICWPASTTDVNGNLVSSSIISGPGSFASGQICFTPAGTGLYTFVLQGLDACGASDVDTVNINVTINSAPVCNVPNDTTIFQCTAAQVCLPTGATDINGNLSSCQILSGPGTLSGGNWCYTPISSQIVNVTVQCTDACGATCVSDFTVEFKINQAPSISFASYGQFFLCASQQICVNYTASDPNDPRPRTVTLVSGSGTLDTANSRVCFTPGATGIYQFIVQVTDECGLFARDTINVDVKLNSAPVANAGPNLTVFQCAPTQLCWPASCTDVDLNLTDCVLTGPGTYSAGQICFTPSLSGLYTFILQATDACGLQHTDTMTVTVTMNSAPLISFGNDTTAFLCTPQQICMPYQVIDPNGSSKLTEVLISGFGTIDTLNNSVCFTPASSGTYEFVVSVTDSCGASDLDTINAMITFGEVAQITCPPAPISASLCGAGQVCQGILITPAGATVSTSFGTFSAGQLCFQADTSGTYIIRVIASSSCGADTCDVTFNVTIGSAAQLTCPGPTVKFLCAPGNVAIPIGVMGNGATVNVTPIGSYSAGNINFTADTSGHYVLTVIASTTCGADTCEVVADITINSWPVAVNPPSPKDTFICASTSICYQFSASDVNGGTLTWSRLSGAGTVTSGGLWCFTANAAGVYSVVAAVTDSCGGADTLTMTYNISLNVTPIIALGIDTTRFQCASVQVCLPYMVTDPNNNVTLEQVISGATIDTVANTVCFTPPSTGVYTIIVQVTDGCGATDRDTINVTINQNNPPVANAGADQTLFVCTPNAICWGVSATDPDNNIDSIKIISGPGTYGAGQICFTPGATDNYQIILRVVDKCGLSDQDTVMINVTLNSPPVCSVPANTTYFQCAPTQVSLPVSATDVDGNFSNCQIVSGPGSISGGQWIYTPSVDEIRKIVVECVDACGATCRDSFTVVFKLNAPPVVNAGSDSTVFLCANQTICWDVVATDEDLNLKSVELTSPIGTYNPLTKKICFNAVYGDQPTGQYVFVVKATDSCDAVDYDTTIITIDYNNKPVVVGPPDFTAYMEQVGQLCFDISISDPDMNLNSINVSPFGSYNQSTGQVCFNVVTKGTYCVYVTATDMCGLLTTDTVCIEVTVDECIHVEIEKTHNTLQGQNEIVNIFMNGSGKQLGGFNFLIAYDPSALTAMNVTPGPLFEQCGWEYFTFRYGADGNCDNCPDGLLRIVGIAETNNGAYHPGCFLDGLVGSLAEIEFMVSNDRTLECQYAPVQFYWLECTDNALSSMSGDTLWINRRVKDFEGTQIQDYSFGLPGYVGAPDYCLVGGGPGKPAPQRCVDFTNGGVDIVCADSIDARADINLNGISYEIADAVLFSNYFVNGLDVFTINQAGQIAASDVNADGLVLTVADLVYLIRAIIGDVPMTPKLSPNAAFSAEVGVVDGALTIGKTDAHIGAIYLTLDGEVAPTLHESASQMEIKYAFDGKVTKVLIYSSTGKGYLATGPVMYLKNSKLIKSVELGSYDGYVVAAKVNALPSEYALSQNYPNPFNPITSIEFALPKAGEWTLTIYNVLGQEVTNWHNSSEAGYQKIEWDAARYASGVYFYRLVAGNFSATRKMVLLK